MCTHAYLKKVTGGIVWLLALCVLLAVPGCKPDKQTAAQISELKSELANVQLRLDNANSQTETLTQQLQALSRALAETQKDVQALAELPKENDVMGSQLTALKTQLDEVVAQRDAAMAEANQTRESIQQLRQQLDEQIQKAADLQTQMADVQQTLAPPAAEPVAAGNTEKPNPKEPIVGFPEAPGFKD